MTGALAFIGIAAIEVEVAHRRVRAGLPCSRLVVDGIIRKAAAALAFFVVFGIGA